MEININCDLGEKSKHHSNKHDPDLLEIVNSANIACGYHAGDEETMNDVIKISKKNNVSIGAHPSFNDPENFGRERMNLSENEIKKLKGDLQSRDREAVNLRKRVEVEKFKTDLGDISSKAKAAGTLYEKRLDDGLSTIKSQMRDSIKQIGSPSIGGKEAVKGEK